MISKLLFVVASVASSAVMSDAFLTAHFFVDCGTTTERTSMVGGTASGSGMSYCYQAQGDGYYYTAPFQTYAFEGDDWNICWGFNSDYDRVPDTACSNSAACTDISTSVQNGFVDAANMQMSGFSLDINGYAEGGVVTPVADSMMECRSFDGNYYTIGCVAEVNTDRLEGGQAMGDGNYYARCKPDETSWTGGEWDVIFYEDSACSVQSATDYGNWNKYCGSASTVTQSVVVTALSIAAALKTVF